VTTAPAQLRDASLASAEGGDLPYEEVTRRIRELVVELTPVGAIVMVVSKGDERLVGFDGRSGWHFPRASTGQYAGHHPPNGEWAVEQLEALRTAGGAYLVLPATYFWWLEHYPELDRHLSARYERLPCAEEVCRIYRLLDLPTAAPRVVPDRFEGNDQRRVLHATRALLGSLLPEEEVVLIASEGDEDLLDLGRPAWHFPHDAAGRHVPLEAADGRHLVEQMRRLRRKVQYLVVPAASLWSMVRSPALAAYLGEECRTLALRDRVCVVYELRSSARTTVPAASAAKEAVKK
jgi:hypothetical protein